MREPDEDKLRGIVGLAEDLKPLLESPAFAGFFNGKEKQLQDAMVGAAVEDDLTRRNAAITLALLKQLRAHLIDCITRGDRAFAKLAEIEKSAKAKKEKVNAG